MNDQGQANVQPHPSDNTQLVSWVHIGDLHMVQAGEQNEHDLGRIVDAINQLNAIGRIHFVFLPGDIADNGSCAAYQVVRSHLDRLTVPWFGIVGDHDVHEKSFDNFKQAISSTLYGSFCIGSYRFLRLNAFSEPRPDSFTLSAKQLSWAESELRSCTEAGQSAILFLHCYPSELKHGREELQELLKNYPVLLIDMGHTHYNEISNDGTVLYSATRSTGQVEEGPVGFSVTTLDRNVVSWYFQQLDNTEFIAIASPADRRMRTSRTSSSNQARFTVDANIWSRTGVHAVTAQIDTQRIPLNHVADNFWSGTIEVSALPDGIHRLAVIANTSGSSLHTGIEVEVGTQSHAHASLIDHDNAIGEWVEKSLLGTQLGPNKNGRKW